MCKAQNPRMDMDDEQGVLMRLIRSSFGGVKTFGLLTSAGLLTSVSVLMGGVTMDNQIADRAQADSPLSSTSPIKADLDGDNIFDDLQARLGAADQSEQIPVIVTLKESFTTPTLERLVRAVGQLQLIRSFSIINGFATRATAQQIKLLSQIPVVEHVEEDSVVRASNASAQSSFGVTKARSDLVGLDGNADGDALTYSKDDLVAAVIDTGIDPGHLDLDDGKIIAFKDYVGGETRAYDDNGHGSHVAATIAGDGEGSPDAANKGVAPGAALVGLKVLNSAGNGSMSNVTAAIDWVVANKATYGIEAINLSLGTSGCSSGTDATSQAVNNAHAAGMVVSVAAGNAGPGTCTIGSPGAAQNAITVGAMTDLGVGGFSLAGFSSRGPTADGRIKPDVVGPGVSIISADAGTTNGYLLYSGTSMAAPFVAGTALLMLDTSPGLSPQQIKDVITSTAVDWGRGGKNATAGSTGPDIDYGAGRLDSYAALASVQTMLTSPPTIPAHRRFEGNLSGAGAKYDVALNVASPSFPLAATLIEPSITGSSASSPDFDLILFAPNGSQVASTNTSKRQESISINSPTTGTYLLRVNSYNGSGPWFVDISGDLAESPLSPPPVVVQPSATKVLTGSLQGGNAASLASDDDVYLSVRSNTSTTRTTSWQASMVGIPRNTTNLDITYKGKNSRNCTQKIHAWRWSDSTWVQLDSRTVGTTEVLISDLTPTGNLANFISGTGATGEVRIRVRCTTRSGTFVAGGELFQLAYTQP